LVEMPLLNLSQESDPMNIFIHELKLNLKTTVLWVASLGVLLIFFLSLYPSFVKDVTTTRKLLASLPAALRAIVGLNLETFFTITGFYSYLFFYVILTGSIQAMNLGISLLSKERALKTVDFLLTKPVARSKIVMAKIIAGLTLLLATNLTVIGVSLGMAYAVSSSPFDVKVFLLISVTLFLVQLFFLSLGLMTSVLAKNIKSVISVSLPIVFSFFIIGMLDTVIGSQAVRYLTPFKFYDFIYIVKHGSYELQFLGLEFLLVTLFIASAFIIFAKKDLPAPS
jgi:ABC-2 type transport system permease protein